MNGNRIKNAIGNFILIILVLLIGGIVVYAFKTEIFNNNQEIVEYEEGSHTITTKLPEDGESKTDIISIEPSNKATISNTTNIDKFYYNQLDIYSKKIYDALYYNKENLKTGTAKIDLDTDLAKFLTNKENESKVEGIFTIAITAFECDNPDVFYVDFSKIILYYESNGFGKSNAYIQSGDEGSYLIDGFNNKEDVEMAENQINTIVEGIKSNTNGSGDYIKVKYIHDWIVKNTKYDMSLSKENRNNIYGLFIEKDVTCGGYANAFKYLMDQVGIDSIVVQGEASKDGNTEYHAWNYVKVDNTWYAIDCTWDDPIVEGVSEENKKIYYEYFLKGTNSFNNHARFNTFYGTDLKIIYPDLSIQNY